MLKTGRNDNKPAPQLPNLPSDYDDPFTLDKHISTPITPPPMATPDSVNDQSKSDDVKQKTDKIPLKGSELSFEK